VNGSSSPDSPVTVVETSPWRSEDIWAIWLAATLLAVSLAATWLARPADHVARLADFEEVTRQLEEAESQNATDGESLAALRKRAETTRTRLAVNPLKPYIAKLSSWDSDPLKAFFDSQGRSLLLGLLGTLVLLLALFNVGLIGLGGKPRNFSQAFVFVFLLATVAFLLSGQKVVKHYNLEYALWALVVGLIVSNTIGTPSFARPAIRTEFYIKTGLVLLGAEVLINRLLVLGLPGVLTSWLVTPVVLIGTYAFGQRVLKMESRSLNMVICADMSVCGVSAAIATAAACRAKKEELSLAIGLSLAFTVGMMVVMPPVIQWLDLGQVVGGAWIGGTIDSTGAVAAAGGMLGDTALAVAATVKMIQNVLIGFVAFGVAIYWVTVVERTPDAASPSLFDVWRRFPKFVLGFLAASIVFSTLSARGPEAQAVTSAVIGGTTETLRGWLFCLAFVSIGLETNFRELRPYLASGKPLVLYVCGQAFNLALSLFMCWLIFEKVFPDVARTLSP
jgi:uncharacterized membrane protein YadS